MKVFCSTSFQSGSCPKCAAKLSAVKYYSAIQGNTSLIRKEVENDWQNMKTTTTTTKSTQYFDIQAHTGSMCLPCCNKAENIRFIVPRVLFGLGVLFLIAALVMIDIDDMGCIIFGWIAAILLFIGWNTMDGNSPYDPLMTSKKYYGSRQIVDISNPSNMRGVSAHFVKYLPKKEIPSGRTILSTRAVEDMKKQK
jgi:hypothetical protein